MTFDNLIYGTYYVKEIQYPEGGNWKKLESPVEFEVYGRLDDG